MVCLHNQNKNLHLIRNRGWEEGGDTRGRVCGIRAGVGHKRQGVGHKGQKREQQLHG